MKRKAVGPTSYKGTTKSSRVVQAGEKAGAASAGGPAVFGERLLCCECYPEAAKEFQELARRSRIESRRVQHWRRRCARRDGQRMRTRHYSGPCRRSGIGTRKKRTRGYAARLVRLCSMEVGVIPNSSGGSWPRFSQNVRKPKQVAPAMSQKLEETKPIDSFGRPSRSIAC